MAALLGVSGLFVAVGALLIALALPTLRRRVPPNAIYGVRIAATFGDEHVWYETNAFFGRELRRLGGALVVAGLLGPFWFGAIPALVALTAVLLIGTVGIALRSTRFARRLLAKRQATPSTRPPHPARRSLR